MRLPSPHVRALRLMVPLCLVALVAGCADGSGAVSASMRSNARPTSTAPTPGAGPGASDSAFCSALAELAAGTGPDVANDPAAVVDAIAALGDQAPAELRDDFDTMASVADELAGLDESDPASLAHALDLVFRPEVLAASEAIATYALETCGVDLGPVDGGTPTPGADQGTDLHLEDVQAVEDAAGTASWVDKISSTAVLNGTAIELGASDGAGLTAAEAMAACTAVRDALVVKNDRVTVTVKRGDVVVAKAAVGSACAPA